MELPDSSKGPEKTPAAAQAAPKKKIGRPLIPPEQRKKHKSGAAKVRAKLEQQLLPPGATPPPPTSPEYGLVGLDDGDFIAAVRDLGPPPEDPIAAIVWGNRLAAITAWAAGTGPLTQRASARRRGVLDAIKALGFTNAKAVDKQLMMRIAKRLGLTQKDADDQLEPIAEGTKALRA